MLSRKFKYTPTLPALACTALLLAACDSTDFSGAAAGDVDNSDAAVALLAPYTGFYDLQNDWSGILGDAAFLIIDAPGSDAISPVAFYDYDDYGNCLPVRPSTGILRKDPASTRVFMDGILQFDEAELSFTDATLSTLSIDFNDYADLDGDGSTLDRVSVSATRMGIILISDLGEPC